MWTLVAYTVINLGLRRAFLGYGPTIYSYAEYAANTRKRAIIPPVNHSSHGLFNRQIMPEIVLAMLFGYLCINLKGFCVEANH